NTFNARPKPLANLSVLFLVPRNATGKPRGPHHFLLHAMGARQVTRARSLEHANELLRADQAETGGNRWQLVNVDGLDEKAKTSVVRDKLWAGLTRGGRRPRLVSDEWIVQSLILGIAIDE